MIEIENSQKQVNIVTFVHTFQIPAREIKHMMPKQFATVYEYGLVNWHIQISESGGIPMFLRNALNGLETRPPVCQIMLNPAGQRDKHPPVLKVDFRLRTLLNSTNYSEPLSFTHPGGFPPRTLLNASYSTPEDSPISSCISSVSELNGNHEFEVQTTIVFDIDEFLDIKYINRSVGKPMPVELNFRYNLLLNQSTHNFTLYILSFAGRKEYRCNKEALFVASPFFRRRLTAEMTDYMVIVDSVEAIEVVVTWLLTETYHPPENMTPKLAEDIYVTAIFFLPHGPQQKQLMGSVERHCYEELLKNLEDLSYIQQMFLVAHKSSLGGLLEACHAVIISFHHMDFLRDFEKNPNRELTNGTAGIRPSALQRFNDNYTRSLTVRCFANKKPVKISQ